ncbi:MAG: hypothetical protein HGB10_08155 [Coriobacteriia bacterium]|nr:hypothetical protein [Coriobacteriia bacterium]
MDALSRLTAADAVARLHRADATLFAGTEADVELAAGSMGWTRIGSCCTPLPEYHQRTLAELDGPLTDVVVLGMGGSSLATLVLGDTLAEHSTRHLHVLDTTAPRTVAAALDKLDPATTLFLVSSKSGGTVEPMSLYSIFRADADAELGEADAGERFIAITDPGTSLETLAIAEGFHVVFHGDPTIGGRFSALSAFGLVPATLLGLDTAELTARAKAMEAECGLPVAFNPGAQLAAFIADNHDAGRDKLTVISSPGLSSFGLWVEQLVAESLGKEGVGVVPIVELAPDNAAGYGPDRAVAVVRFASDETLAREASVLGESVPVIELVLDDPYDVGGEFVRWEYAVALVGFLLGVNPFGQPNVAAAKAATNAVLAGELDVPKPTTVTADGIAITYAGGLVPAENTEVTVAGALGDAFAQLRGGDYLCLLAYLPEDEGQPDLLARAVPGMTSDLGVPVALELGPRYLHSTGQLHKGGPDNTVFVLVTTRDPANLRVPGREWSLRDLHAAQAAGDLAILAGAGRRILRIDLPDAEPATIARLERALAAAADAARRA